jgi:hypothetical protein
MIRKILFSILGVGNKMWIVIESSPPPQKKKNPNYLHNCETLFFATVSVCFLSKTQKLQYSYVK